MGERGGSTNRRAALAGILERGPELNSIGAERLLGAGDMLFMPPGSPNLRRLHGPFVSEAEIRKLCDFLRAQGSPDYQKKILESSATGGDDSSHRGNSATSSTTKRCDRARQRPGVDLDDSAAAQNRVQPLGQNG